jgi:glucosyl-3-phosphoglycerate synthase
VSVPADLPRAEALKGSTTVSVILPARDEAATVGLLVQALTDALAGLVDEIVVVDDGSADATAQVALAAGARVITAQDVRPDIAPAGKGGAMWRGLAATTGDLVVFLDADVADFAPAWVASLLLPLLEDPDVHLVKAAYERPLEVDGVVHPGSGGRVTRLLATPLLSLVAPDLTVFAQPLAGETAARRGLLSRVELLGGYGVELALLLDAHALVGLDGLAQVDLGERRHRHQSDEALAHMATSVLAVVADRQGWPVKDHAYSRVRRQGAVFEHVSTPLTAVVLPPLASEITPSGRSQVMFDN